MIVSAVDPSWLIDQIRAMRREIGELRAEVAALHSDRNDDMLTVDAAAELLGTSPAALRKKIQRGTVPSVRSGRSIRIRRRDLVSK